MKSGIRRLSLQNRASMPKKSYWNSMNYGILSSPEITIPLSISYYKFLVKYEKEYKVRLSGQEEKMMEFISRKLASGKRIHELELLRRMLSYRKGLMGMLTQSLKKDYGISLSKKGQENVINMMTNEFPSGSGKKTYEECVFLSKDGQGDYEVSDSFAKMLVNPDFYQILEEVVAFGISRFHRDYSNRYEDTDFVQLNKKDVLMVFPEEHKNCKTVRILKTPKTEKSVRKIYIPMTVAKQLCQYKATQEERKEILGSEYQDYNMVLASMYGLPLGSEYIRKRFNRLIRDLHLRKVVFHSLRHYVECF